MISFGLCEDAARIRKEVFVEEQGFQKEFDEIDPIALHVVLYRDGEPAATGRLFRRDRAAIEAMGTGGGQTRLAGDVSFDGGRVESIEEVYRRETAAGDGCSAIECAEDRLSPARQNGGQPQTDGRRDPGTVWVIGRIAVRQKFRGLSLGRAVMQTLESEAAQRGGGTVVLSAQLQAEEFYRKQGYLQRGEVYLDEHCPHVEMIKKL